MKIPQIAGLQRAERLDISAVYFLCLGDEVRYVGRTRHLFQRIGNHCANMEFDSIYYLPCSLGESVLLEAKYISELNPPLNYFKTNIRNEALIMAKEREAVLFGQFRKFNSDLKRREVEDLKIRNQIWDRYEKARNERKRIEADAKKGITKQ